jgi:membrane protein
VKDDPGRPASASGHLRKRFVVFARILGTKVEQARARIVTIPFFAFLNEVFEGMGNDGAAEFIGAISYYVVLSLFPLLLGVISLLGFFLPSATVQDQIFNFVEANLPATTDILRLNVAGIIQVRGPLGIFSVVALFWSAGAMFNAISRGVNRAWGINVRHPFHIRKLRETTMSLGACVFFYVAITLTAILKSFGAGGGVVGGLAISLLELLLVFVIFILVYKFIPGTKTYWSYVWPGAIFSTVAFEVVRTFLAFYFSRFSNVQLVYGSIASIIVLLLFVQYVALILIMGAEISSEYSRVRLGLGPRPRFPPDLYQR